ncbi:flagellar protein export ATPase FliI [Gluconobacter sphaericus]|uniref:Flagellum-specific ATP synthase n=1 Tax=Gluconobacter sphaericus NBRC 12467 TaxID=1307951 RepID=A0AA37SEK2_9PROT|nr:flagellar protein export ATPase FliI [Gluconobacter sphaericus]MBF0884600.1 flagellar protein export ATPase FliI [Gluconobacter sphaericus]GBR53579.1 flagellum-specific ATP synthase [Gluconobacter sphaericus NBRC 12467]GEB41384.1 flagellum-specific ATP synthase [Gluconobacter sphaericus NBRC 12467]GLQ83494.1 flagellum-specific ATP synthase [Gluconobacter sphaericus NBRC 12467]
MVDYDRLLERLSNLTCDWVLGSVKDVIGLCLTVIGLEGFIAIGDRVAVKARDGRIVQSEVVGFQGDVARLMSFGSLDGIGPGCEARIPLNRHDDGLGVNEGWLGRVLDPLGQPIDGKGPLFPSFERQPVQCPPPNAASRARLGERIDLGVRALDTFATCRRGQRLGLFAGSGVGKSTLLSMLARGADCDVAVISLVGERGREVREFLEDDLGPEGLARSVLVIATSDSPPLMRREAALSAMAIAEYFRNQGKSVLLLMDSVTRFCMALREIGLSAGEPPATRGYPPSVFAELPRLLERAGPGYADQGMITALFTVLVEGDDQNEPVADAVRGILDGHVILDRKIGEQGRYPAVDVLRSLSRAVPGCNSPEENALTQRARVVMATYQRMADMIRLGAYKPGTDREVDEAIALIPKLNEFLSQGRNERTTRAEAFEQLAQIMQMPLKNLPLNKL